MHGQAFRGFYPIARTDNCLPHRRERVQSKIRESFRRENLEEAMLADWSCRCKTYGLSSKVRDAKEIGWIMIRWNSVAQKDLQGLSQKIGEWKIYTFYRRVETDDVKQRRQSTLCRTFPTQQMQTYPKELGNPTFISVNEGEESSRVFPFQATPSGNLKIIPNQVKRLHSNSCFFGKMSASRRI